MNLNVLRQLKNLIKARYSIYRGIKDGLLYIGKAKNGIKARYTLDEIAEWSITAIQDLDKIEINNATALGIGQLLPDLNGGVKEEGVLANVNNATVKQEYIDAGRLWLDENIPDWQTIFKIK